MHALSGMNRPETTISAGSDPYSYSCILEGKLADFRYYLDMVKRNGYEFSKGLREVSDNRPGRVRSD